MAFALALSGCVSAPQSPAPVPLAQAPLFDPFIFFAGASAGEGTLAKAMAGPVAVRVTSTGRIETEVRREAAWAAPPRRVLVLDQVVREGDKPARKRQWCIHEVAPGRYAGSLTGALTPIDGRTEGNRLVLTFTIKGGLSVRQELTLSADGQRAANVMRVTKLGLTVAVLSEDIRKAP
jgi:hypothetical protein